MRLCKEHKRGRAGEEDARDDSTAEGFPPSQGACLTRSGARHTLFEDRIECLSADRHRRFEFRHKLQRP
jgi:hypothetical protein